MNKILYQFSQVKNSLMLDFFHWYSHYWKSIVLFKFFIHLTYSFWLFSFWIVFQHQFIYKPQHILNCVEFCFEFCLIHFSIQHSIVLIFCDIFFKFSQASKCSIMFCNFFNTIVLIWDLETSKVINCCSPQWSLFIESTLQILWIFLLHLQNERYTDFTLPSSQSELATLMVKCH